MKSLKMGKKSLLENMFANSNVDILEEHLFLSFVQLDLMRFCEEKSWKRLNQTLKNISDLSMIEM